VFGNRTPIELFFLRKTHQAGVRRFGTWAHWSPLFESPKNSNFKALKKFKKNMWT
jgi:hypothetical protein